MTPGTAFTPLLLPMEWIMPSSLTPSSCSVGRKTVRRNCISPSNTASPMPLITPTSSTLRKVNSARRNACALRRRKTQMPRMSSSDQAAYISTTPNPATGINCSGAIRNSKTKAMTAAAMTDTSWLLPPLASFTAVRESAPLMAKPCDSAETIFTSPSARNSASAFTS